MAEIGLRPNDAAELNTAIDLIEAVLDTTEDSIAVVACLLAAAEAAVRSGADRRLFLSQAAKMYTHALKSASGIVPSLNPLLPIGAEDAARVSFECTMAAAAMAGIVGMNEVDFMEQARGLFRQTNGFNCRPAQVSVV